MTAAIPNPLDGLRPSLGPLSDLLGPVGIVLGVVALVLALVAVAAAWRTFQVDRRQADEGISAPPRPLGSPRGLLVVVAVALAAVGVLLIVL